LGGRAPDYGCCVGTEYSRAGDDPQQSLIRLPATFLI
jgi:hypothetical protein